MAPVVEGTTDFRIVCTVTDEKDETVSDTLVVTVFPQYYPLALDYYWKYVEYLETRDDTLVYEVTIVENVGRVWEVERVFYTTSGLIDLGPPDTFEVETVFADDSVWIDDPALSDRYMGLFLPLWVDKTWDTQDGGTGTVTEMADQSVPVDDFTDCIHVILTGGQVERDIWFAPNVGMIISSFDVPIIGEVMMELVEYDLE